MGMTREEAIHFANCLKKNYTIDFNDMEEFCDMAIEALEQEPILDKIRAEIDTYLEIEGFGSEYRNDVKKIIDKYKAESEDKE